ncbi:hypothetical protein DT73_00085 [Mangrovibacter sp. MFB070]|uniref:DUF4056 domain-containing protein n=1 Tax=Mangrovibacter sp. MFB070 TaxID=1224318 RepID=UPI0004D3D235|nr:DUF4056 domain-containing protein [Mangrovibacter sp. MFB070]KEA54600.1 hypothetical protein DT73_00085 [Mangrovibacter sp. MFB070]
MYTRLVILIFILWCNTVSGEPVINNAPVVTAEHLAAPSALRPCCAFGNGLKVKIGSLPVPFYRVDNIFSADNPGHHHYNDSHFAALVALSGLGRERNGIIYTHHGGFIDIAHVRDTADNTFYLFTQIYPRLGQEWRLFLSEELGVRRIQLYSFTPPAMRAERYRVSAWLAGQLAFQLAQWHEIAQWYGYQSVSGFPEAISAFSPEDLYSNLLGARLAIAVILRGEAGSVTQYNNSMDARLSQALLRLGAVSRKETEERFSSVDGVWWDSTRRVPDKYLVLRRNYDLRAQRQPLTVPGEDRKPYLLQLPGRVNGAVLSQLGELEIYPGESMKALPSPAAFYAPADFVQLAEIAKRADSLEHKQTGSRQVTR